MTPLGNSPEQRKLLLPLVLVGGFVFLALAGAAGIAWFRDPMPPLTVAEFGAARTRWNDHGPDSYDMDLRLGGARPGRVHIQVRDGKPVAMTRDGHTPSQPRTWAVWTVDGQFDTIDRELQMQTNPHREMQAAEGTQLVLRAQFDPQLGYPLRFRRIVLGQGPEVFWEVERFTAR